MNSSRNKYDLVFFVFLLSVLISFFYLREFNSPWNRMINGDGLGYYSYLPAKYIYHDNNYEFKWFNKVFEKHYAPGTFPNPEDNFLVKYGDRKINKYYQGLSYIWLPFFAAGHFFAKILGYPMDGYSQPYQLSVGFASLLYLLLGLFFLRRLLQRLFNTGFVSTFVPIVIFYGTWLFNYSIYYNALSHVYSFTLTVLFIYFLTGFFNEEAKWTNGLLCLLVLVLSLCIRPLNAILIFLIPAFLPKNFLRTSIRFEKLKIIHVIIVLILLGALYHQLSITKIQTGSFFPDTYTDEAFHFDRAVFFDALISYRLGLVIYAPLILLCFFGFRALDLRMAILLVVFFFGVLFLYSAWWYWPIVKRAMVDFYVIPAIFLGALFTGLRTQSKKVIIFLLAGLSVLFFQLKNYQMSHGILDEFYTYKELFWRNFFRVKPASLYLVDPAEVVKEKTEIEDFEQNTNAGNISNAMQHSGQHSLLLDSQNYAAQFLKATVPDWFVRADRKRIRISFWLNAGPEVKQIHVFLKLLNEKNEAIKEFPFYINKDLLFADSWDYKEFGVDFTDDTELKKADINSIELNVWNVENKNRFYVDDAKIEFFLTRPVHDF